MSKKRLQKSRKSGAKEADEKKSAERKGDRQVSDLVDDTSSAKPSSFHRHFLVRHADMLLAAFAALLFNLHLLLTSDDFLGSGTDIVSLEYPLHAFALKWLSEGVLPLWNPALFCGVPFQAGVHGYFYPGFLTGLFLDIGWDIKLSIVLHLMTAAAGGAWFARSRCTHWMSRFFLGVVFALSAFMTLHLYAGHRVLCATAALLPWAAGAVDRVVEQKSSALKAAAAIFGLVMLSGHYQMIFIFGFGFTLFLVLETWMKAERPIRILAVARPFAVLLGLAVLGALIAAVQLFPMAANVASSQRPGDSAAFAASFSASPSSLVTYLFPGYFGNRVDTPFKGDFAYWESVGYIGILPLLLVIAGAAALPFRKVFPAAAVIVTALILAMGAHTPLFDLYLTVVPGAKLFRSPGRFALLVALFGGLVGAMFLDHLIGALPFLRERKKRVLVAAWAPFVLAAGFMTQTSSGEIQKAVVLFFVGAVLLSVAMWQSKSAKSFALLLVAISVMDLYHFGHRFMVAGSPDIFEVQEGLLHLLKRAEKPGARVIPPADGRVGNYLSLFDLTQPGGYDIFIDGRVAEFLNRSQNRNPESFLSIERLRRGSRLLHRLGAEYLVASSPLKNGGNRSVRGFEGFRYVEEDSGYYLYRDPAPDPRAALVHEVTVVAEKETLFATLESADFDMRRRTLVEEALPPEFPPPAPAGSGVESVSISEYTPNRVELDATAASDAVLVLSDTYMPGWHASVDGREAPILRANAVMRAVPVPKGSHHIVMWYRPWSFVLGAVVSILSIVALIAFFGVTRRRSRRR